MHTDPPNLCFSPPADRAYLVIGRALGINAESEAHRLQRCDYRQVKDTCTVEHRPNTHATMDSAHRAPGASGSEDATEIEYAFRNASITGCKDVLPAFRSSHDNDDERGGEDQVDARMSDDLSFNGVGSVGASRDSDANPAKCSGQGSMLWRRVMRRLSRWHTMLILTRIPCALMQLLDFMPTFLQSLRVLTPTFCTVRYASFLPVCCIWNQNCTPS